MVQKLRDSIGIATQKNDEYAIEYMDISLVGKTIFEQQRLLYHALLEWLDTFEIQFKLDFMNVSIVANMKSVKTDKIKEKRINPKRMQREINSQLQDTGIGTNGSRTRTTIGFMAGKEKGKTQRAVIKGNP